MILFGVLQGIIVAVVLAILLFFRRNWWPHGVVLGMVEGLDGWHGDRRLSGRPADPRRRRLPLGGAAVLCERRASSASRSATWCASGSRIGSCCSARPITDVDVTAAEMLKQLDIELNAAGIHMAFAEMRGRLQDLTLRYGLFETLDRDHFYPTLDTAIAAIETDPFRQPKG